MFTAVITLPCTAAGQIENWPAFWLDGTTGTWPAHGEIDVMEGLHGHAAWHYHYLNAAGEDAQVGATVPEIGAAPTHTQWTEGHLNSDITMTGIWRAE